VINTMGIAFSGTPVLPPFRLPTPPSASVDILSVYQPFPLRVDSFGEQGKQYDACFQIGEFPGKNVKGSDIVILIPLKVHPNPGIGGEFVNAFANKIPNILGAQPDPLQGYPDVPAHTGATWDIAKVVDVTRPYYTWAQSDNTRVIVMAEPILISQGDMNNIQRLPVTPPEDVIHEIGTPILYHPAPPRDANGKPVACPPSAFQAASNRVVQPPVPDFKPVVKSDTILAVLLAIIGTLAIVIGVWFGVKLAAGPGGDAMKKIGDSIGKTLAGSYAAVKKASPTISIPTAPPKDTSAFSMQNPGFSSKADFIASRRRTPTAAPKPGLTVRTPPPAAPKPKINSGLTVRTPPAAPKPKPKPADPVVMSPNPSGETRDQFIARMKQRKTGGKRRRRNRMKTGRKV
jgi:hypothetical protein